MKKGNDCRFSGDLQLKRKTDDRQKGFVRLGLRIEISPNLTKWQCHVLEAFLTKKKK